MQIEIPDEMIGIDQEGKGKQHRNGRGHSSWEEWPRFVNRTFYS